MVLPGYVVPGQVVCEKEDAEYSKYIAGSGVEVTERGLVATILGKLVATSEGSKWKVEIVNEFRNPYAQIPTKHTGNSKRSTSQLPQVGDAVYAKVLRMNQQQVTLDIIAVENKGLTTSDNGVGSTASAVGSVHPPSGSGDRSAELDEGYGAVIRVQDIRASQRDKIKVYEQFSPGDLVRASVLSLGDEQHYYLSTIRNDLGVIFATDHRTGDQLVPLDWQTMLNPKTGTTFPRKCANPFVEN